MPVQDCSERGRPGKRWGMSGKCYTYDPKSPASKSAALKQAFAQGAAIEHAGGEVKRG